MLTSLAAAALASLAFAQQSDTTLAVRPGTRLEVENFAGEIAVGSWERDAVRISANRSERDRVEVEHEEGVVGVDVSREDGPSGIVELRITVPRWMPIELSGVHTDVSVEGVNAEVTAETVEGAVSVRGGEGFVTLSSVQGEIVVERARGHIDLSSVNDGIRVTEAAGEISAETVNGAILLERIDSASVDATTVNGSITYDGAVSEGGRYSFSTHNGALTVAVPEGTNASVTVATFNGDFESSFPVTLAEGRHGGRSSFVLGAGGARLDLESFQGPIQLLRQGEFAAGGAATSQRPRRGQAAEGPQPPRSPRGPAEAPEPPRPPRPPAEAPDPPRPPRPPADTPEAPRP